MKQLILIASLATLLLPFGASAQLIYPNRGGLGTSTIPTYGQIPVGNAQGTYTLTATSSLGISGGSGSSIGTNPLTATYFTSTGTATSTFPALSITSALSLLGEYITDLTTWVRGKIDAYLTGGEGVTYTSGAISFDCSEVEGTGINCSGEDITLDATGDWTGTLDGLNGTDLLALSTWYATTTDGLDEGLANVYYTDARARAAISENASGLTYSNSTGVFSMASGYEIPLTASTSQWATAYGWGDHAAAGYITTDGQFSTTSADYWDATKLRWATTSSNYWESQQTARTADDLSNNTTSDLAEGTNLYFTPARGLAALTGQNVEGQYFTATGTATSTFPHLIVSGAIDLFGTFATQLSDLCVAITGGSGLCDGVDNEGTGGNGLATSTPIANTQIIYGTSASAVGSEAAFTYNDALDKLTAVNASTTNISATTIWGALTGNVTGTASGNDILGQATSTLASHTTTYNHANYDTAYGWGNHASAGYQTAANVYSIVGGTTTLANLTITAAQVSDLTASVNSYIHGSTTIPKTYTANTFTGLQTIGNASTTHLSVSGSSFLGTVRTGTWNGSSLADAYVDDTITASNYLTLSAWYATTTQDIAESGNLYYTDARVGSFISGSTTVPHIGGSALGDLLYWTGTAWGTRATSTLGISWNDLRSVPAGFADGVDDTGGTLSGGSTNALAYWTSGSTLSATSSPTVGYITATSGTSTLPNLSVTGFKLGSSYITGFGTGLTTSANNLVVDNTGDWNGPISGNIFGTALVPGALWYGASSGAGDIAQLTLGASSTILTNDGTSPRWLAGSALCVAITGSTDLCDGSDATGVGGSGVVASSTATYVVYKQGTTYYAYNASTTAVTSNADFDVLLQSLVDVLDGGRAGGIIHIKSGDYYANATTSIAGNDSGSYNNGGRVTIQGDGTDSTRIIMYGNADFLDFEDAAIFSVKDLSVYVTGGSNGFVSDSNDNNARAGWLFSFENIHVAATTTHTGRAFDLGNVFRGTFTNIEMFGVHHCMRFRAEGTFNPGDFVLSRAFCELDNTANGISYEFTEDSTGFMNQVHFEMVEGIAQSTGAKFIKAEDLSFATLYNLNAEQYDYLVDQDAGSGVTYHFNYATHRNAIASLKGCRFAVNASGNTCEFRMLNTTANFQVIDDANTWGDNPNTFIGYIGADSGTASASSSGTTVYRDVKGYGTLDTNLAPGGLFGIFQVFGPFVAKVGATILGFLDIPSGTSPTVDAEGELALDTTDNQLIMGDSGGTAVVVAKKVQEIFKVTVASTSQAFIEAGLLPIPTQLDGYTITAIRCKVDGGTNKVVAVEDASANSTEDITCTTSVTSDDGSITNAVATAAEEMYIDFGATSGTVNYVTVSVFGTWTRE